MTSATKEAGQAKNGAERLSYIEYPLWDVVCWQSILYEIVEKTGQRHLSGMEREVAGGQLSRVNDALKEAVEELWEAYHGRDVFEDADRVLAEEEEAAR